MCKSLEVLGFALGFGFVLALGFTLAVGVVLAFVFFLALFRFGLLFENHFRILMVLARTLLFSLF